MTVRPAGHWFAVVVVALLMSGCAGGPAPSAPVATPTSGSDLPAQPWLLYEWYPAGADQKSQFIAGADGSSPAEITADVAIGAEKVHSDWSPDGMRIAFEALGRDDVDSIWIADADGSDAVEAITCETPDCLQQAYPAWSPDGKSILFLGADKTGDVWGKVRIEVVDLDSRDRRTLVETADGLSAYYTPRWSPDGTRVIAQHETYSEAEDLEIVSSEIVVMPSDGSAPPTPLTDASLFAGHADWSPDGSTIVFDSFDLSAFFPAAPGDSNLYLMNPDGSNLRQLTDLTLDGLERIGEPAWTPDGSRIVATRAPLSPSGKAIQNALIVYVDPVSGEISETGIQGAEVRLQPVVSP
ncbi:TolB family protein [Naasia lichenicola]|nr:PD40 domain-containing protein [Naasia lichenicola]